MDYYVRYFDGFGRFHWVYHLVEGALTGLFDLKEARKHAAEEVKKGACTAEIYAHKEGEEPPQELVARCHRSSAGGATWEKI